MISSFFGIEMGKRGLQNFKTALDVTGHNINNVATKGYSRQRVVMTSFNSPLDVPTLNRAERAGQIGQGAEITTIERIRDQFIDSKIVAEMGTSGYWNTRFNYLNQLESVYNEPGDNNLRSNLDAFWNGWQEIANNPTERASRFVVLERAERINSSINTMYEQMRLTRNNINDVIETKVKRVNEIAYSVRDLNKQILELKAIGDNPNDLLDKRDLLIDELSNIADISVKSTDPDETIVYIGSRHLIQGGVVSDIKLTRNPENEGYFDASWNIDGLATNFGNGELKALFELRDKDIVQAINDLDSFALNLAESVNEIHRDGFGINQETGINFFDITPLSTSAIGNYDINRDGEDDSTLLFKMTGVNSLNANDMVASSGTLTFGNVLRDGENITVNYSSQMKVQDVIDKINSSEANVSAYLDHRNRLVFKARVFDDYTRPSYFIKHVEDSGDLLVGISGMLKESGNNGAFTYNTTNEANKLVGDARHFSTTPYRHPAEAMRVNAMIKNDINYIASSKGLDTAGTGSNDKWNGIGDGSNALEIANVRFKEMMVDSKSTFNDFYTGSVSRVAARTETANVEKGKQGVVVGYLEKLRQSISGVNLDEELTQMITYQHGYNASAKIVSVMDQLLDTVINRMGV